MAIDQKPRFRGASAPESPSDGNDLQSGRRGLPVAAVGAKRSVADALATGGTSETALSSVDTATMDGPTAAKKVVSSASAQPIVWVDHPGR